MADDEHDPSSIEPPPSGIRVIEAPQRDRGYRSAAGASPRLALELRGSRTLGWVTLLGAILAPLSVVLVRGGGASLAAAWTCAGSISVGCIAVGVTRIVNRTSIAVSDRVLTVCHRPIAWRPERQIAVGDIQQIYYEELRIQRSSRAPARYDYRVNTRLRDGSEQQLITLRTEAHARYIEETLEQAMSLEDAPAPGEADRLR